MKQRIFKIRPHLLTGSNPGSLGKVKELPGKAPIPDSVWIRYQLTLRAMDKRFNSSLEMFDYIIELEDFIYSAEEPGQDEFTV